MSTLIDSNRDHTWYIFFDRSMTATDTLFVYSEKRVRLECYNRDINKKECLSKTFIFSYLLTMQLTDI